MQVVPECTSDQTTTTERTLRTQKTTGASRSILKTGTHNLDKARRKSLDGPRKSVTFIDIEKGSPLAQVRVLVSVDHPSAHSKDSCCSVF